MASVSHTAAFVPRTASSVGKDTSPPADGVSLRQWNADRLEGLECLSTDSVKRAESLAASVSDAQDANALYQRCFQLLKLGGLEAEIPRLVVFGQQSMGKTTLLGTLRFPTDLRSTKG